MTRCIHFDIVWSVYGVRPGCRINDTFVYWIIPLNTEKDWNWANELLGTNVTQADVKEQNRFTNAHVPIKDMWARKYVFKNLCVNACEMVIRSLEEQIKIWEEREKQTKIWEERNKAKE